MEAIKIYVEVSVNLSESTQNFIKSLFAVPHCEDRKPEVAVKSVVTSAPTQPAASAPSKPDATPALGASATPATSSASKNIEDVRGMLAKKVNDHRDIIKQKLNELGAPSVTKLDPAKYNEMYNFLAAL